MYFVQNDKKQSIITIALFVMKKPTDLKSFNDGGLSRCSIISSKENILKVH